MTAPVSRVVRPYAGRMPCVVCTGPKPLPAKWIVHMAGSADLTHSCTDHVGKACADLTRVPSNVTVMS